jgi:hypothetical protein
MSSACVALLSAFISIGPSALAQPVAPARQNTFTASPFTGFSEPQVEALLYNPPAEEYRWKDLDANEPVTRTLKPLLLLFGRGFADGAIRITYRIESAGKSLHAGTSERRVFFGRFELAEELVRGFPEATHVSYELTGASPEAIRGRSELRWSRFHGQVKYLDGGWRSTYAELRPNGFVSKALFNVPVGDDGRFDARLPARVYPVINVNGAGYSRDAMERWAWDYDLTRDREDLFTIGRTELYSIHAFNIVGGPSTILVAFRPTALTRLLHFDSDGDGRLSDQERKALSAALEQSPTAIGPELRSEDVSVWVNGNLQKIAQFNQIPEYDGGYWQVQYLIQFMAEPRLVPGVWQELKLEVRSKENLRGRDIVDFGQGSVGFCVK